jgi:hypothetical protein
MKTILINCKGNDRQCLPLLEKIKDLQRGLNKFNREKAMPYQNNQSRFYRLDGQVVEKRQL